MASVLSSADHQCADLFLCRAHETYTSVLHFILSQSAAAAQVGLCICSSCGGSPTLTSNAGADNLPLCCLQATAIAVGANHSAALMLPGQDNKSGHHSLYTMGRGGSC